MHILLINDDLPPEMLGGSGNVVVSTAQALVRRGHRVTVLGASDREGWAALYPGVEMRVIPRLPHRWSHYRSVFSSARATEITKIIEQQRPDVIHAHGLAWQMGYRWIDRVADHIPCFYTAHGMMAISYGKMTGEERLLWFHDFLRAGRTYNPLRNIIILRELKHMRRILCVSDALRHHLGRYGFTNMETLRNGIDAAFWAPTCSRADARRSLGLPADAPIFLLAGRLGHAKGLDLILSLWPSLRGDAVLVLAGQVPSAYATDHPRIRVLPEQSPEQMRLLYTAVDVNLVPSLCFDCFPTTSLESMACGTPVVMTVRGGGREAIIDSKTGWMVDPRSQEQVRDRMQWCIDHRAEVLAVGSAAREHVGRHFSLEQHVDALLRLYARYPAKTTF